MEQNKITVFCFNRYNNFIFEFAMIFDKNIKHYRASALKESINKGFTPRFLYKYVSMETAKIILKDSTLKFSIPSEFNDPFDCKANILIGGSLRDIFFHLCRMFHDLFTIDELYQKAAEIHVNPIEREYFYKSSLEDVINQSGVCCFSKINNQILMWSHYANKHTGVCLKFDLCEDLNFFSPIGIVRYETKFLEYNFAINPETVIEHVCRKAKDWEYEKEVRVFRSKEAGIFQFNVKSLVGIIFGCKVNESECNSLKNIVSKMRYPNVSFQKAVIRPGEYALDIIDASH